MVIKHTITKDKEGQYYTLPFDVPENVTKITVTYDSSAGYLCQRINKGSRNIIIGAYHVMESGERSLAILISTTAERCFFTVTCIFTLQLPSSHPS